jgi:membrane protease YdiL (CAAX protease family)
MMFVIFPGDPLSFESLVKVFFEELLFRFSMLGIMGKYLDFEKRYRLIFILILNSVLFSSLHFQYSTIGAFSTVFIQGLNFAITFVSLGIIPTIATHLLWNYYFPNIVPQLPILFLTVGLPIYDNYQEKRMEKMKRIILIR